MLLFVDGRKTSEGLVIRTDLPIKVIYKNKYTDAVGFDFAQPTDRSRVERSRNSPTQVFSLSEIT
ncbi:hypothetical protein [Nostoc sp.]|uniref:hypothetical protein n=1 Tax=Nostoc sp. TaxID=1180 RepID=UPI002FFA82C9